MLEQGELDLTVIVRDFVPPELEAKTLLREEMRVIVPFMTVPLPAKPVSACRIFEKLVMFRPGYFHRKIMDR